VYDSSTHIISWWIIAEYVNYVADINLALTVFGFGFNQNVESQAERQQKSRKKALLSAFKARHVRIDLHQRVL